MYIGINKKNFNYFQKVVTFGGELLQFIYVIMPSFSIKPQILATFGESKCFIYLVTKSSNLASSTPPLKEDTLCGFFLWLNDTGENRLCEFGGFPYVLRLREQELPVLNAYTYSYLCYHKITGFRDFEEDKI